MSVFRNYENVKAAVMDEIQDSSREPVRPLSDCQDVKAGRHDLWSLLLFSIHADSRHFEARRVGVIVKGRDKVVKKSYLAKKPSA